MKSGFILSILVFSSLTWAVDKCKVGVRASWGGFLDDSFSSKTETDEYRWNSRQAALRLLRNYPNLEVVTPRVWGEGRGDYDNLDFELVSGERVTSEKLQTRALDFSVREVRYKFNSYPSESKMPHDFYKLRPSVTYRENAISVEESDPWKTDLAEMSEMLSVASALCMERSTQKRGIYFNVSGCFASDEKMQLIPEFAGCMSQNPASDSEKALAYCKSKKFNSVISFKVNRDKNFSEIKCSADLPNS